jgi:hypothetical protein
VTALIEQSNSLAVSPDSGSIAAFASTSNYETAKRMATALSQSTIVPKEYQNNVPNCLVAMELAGRTGASVMMVMQSLHIIQGRPSWSAQFLVASVNSCGRFSPIRYEVVGEPGKAGSKTRAIARDLASGDVLEGEWITMEMANAEGWSKKSGSKWLTMPGQMMRYRAAAFWVRVYAPEISIGMHTAEEVHDFTPHTNSGMSEGARDLNEALRRTALPSHVPVAEVEAEITKQDVYKCGECGCEGGEHSADCSQFVD